MKFASFLPRCVGWYRRKVAAGFAQRPFVLRNTVPLVSFSFDDFPVSALSNGGRILEDFGARGTYYFSYGLMGRAEPTGKMFSSEDLSAVIGRGHELGCHTFDHCHASRTPPARFESSVIKNRRALQEQLPGAVLSTLSYPIDVPRPGTKRLCARHFLACRAGGQAINRGTIDLNYLQSFFIEKSRGEIEVMLELIAENARRKGWLIFSTHDVTESPTRYGCTPRVFERLVRCAVESGAQVVPVTRALQVAGIKSEMPGQPTVQALAHE